MPPVDPALKDWLEVGSYIATVLGIPIALALFWNERRRERIAREEQVYASPNAQYLEYLKVCLAHPELDIFDLVTPTQRTPNNTKREWIAFTMLISTMEHAYLLYRNHPNEQNRQWQGWCDYIRWWLARPNFRAAWDGLTDQFDTDFVAFAEALPPWSFQPVNFSYAWMGHQRDATPTAEQASEATAV